MAHLSSRRRGAAVAAASIIAVALTAVTASARSRATRPPSSDVFTTIVATPLADARPVLGADGRRHLAYELQIINPYVTVTITRVDTLDADTDEVLASLEGDAVAAHMQPLTAGSGTGSTLEPGNVAVLVLDASISPVRRVPRKLVHMFSLSRTPDVPGTPSVVRIAPTDVERDRPIVIDPPLAGDRWVDINGCCAELTSHRGAANLVNGAFVVAQRFAIDFGQLDANGRAFVGPPDQLSSYPFYGANVLAVADGVVVRVQDDVPDNTPGTAPPIDITLKTVPGNYVIVDLGGGRFAAYGHLQPGSLAVGVGDHVRRGQTLARLGNSGNSDAPHLHFQVIDGDLFLGSNGLPYEFRSFDSEGVVANPAEVLAGGPATFDPTLAGPHTRQLPLDLQVVSFPTPARDE